MSVINHYPTTQEVSDLLYSDTLTSCEKLMELTLSTNSLYSTDATRLLNLSADFRDGKKSELITAVMLRDVAKLLENICACPSFDIFNVRMKAVEEFASCLGLTPTDITRAVKIMDFDGLGQDTINVYIKKYILIYAILPLVFTANGKSNISTTTIDIKTIIVAAGIKCEELTVSSKLRDIIKILFKEVPNMTYVKNMSAYYRLKDSKSPINKE